MTYPQWMFRDPAIVAENNEARSCKGCAWEKSARLMGTTHTICTKLLPNGRRREHGKRCPAFTTGETDV